MMRLLLPRRIRFIRFIPVVIIHIRRCGNSGSLQWLELESEVNGFWQERILEMMDSKHDLMLV